MAKAQFLSDKILCFFFQVLYDDLQAQIDQENEGQEEQEEQEVAEDHEQEQDNKYKEFQQELESKLTFVEHI